MNFVQWSEKYYPHLTSKQHEINNIWFYNMRNRLTSDGFLIVPELDKKFNKSGEEVSS